MNPVPYIVMLDTVYFHDLGLDFSVQHNMRDSESERQKEPLLLPFSLPYLIHGVSYFITFNTLHFTNFFTIEYSENNKPFV